MSRPLRIEYEGAWYHVMNRGAGKQRIYHDDGHRKLFIDLLHQIHNRYRIEIHAYCLMDNHYHLLIRTPLANLSRAMRHLDGVYTQRYNKAAGTDGPLFRGRFKAIIVESDNYLLRLSRYIHLNPVVGGIVKRAEQYHWSSYAAFLNPKLAPCWLSVKETLNAFGVKNRRQKYRLFIEEGVDKELNTFFDKIRRVPILGSEAFVKTITEKYLSNRDISKEISEQKYLHETNLPSIDEIMKVVANYYQIDRLKLKNVDRSLGNRPRSIGIYLACKLSGQRIQLIADKFTKISYSGVSQAMSRMDAKLQNDKQIAEEISALEKILMYDVKT